jgi:hypothetical protein
MSTMSVNAATPTAKRARSRRLTRGRAPEERAMRPLAAARRDPGVVAVRSAVLGSERVPAG